MESCQGAQLRRPRGGALVARVLGRWSLALASVVSVAVPVSVAAPAQAAEAAEQKAAAESLFDEGKRLLNDQKYAEACVRFEQSQAADSGVGTLLYLADCYERIDRLASAWATFREAASAAREAGQGNRASTAEARAESLRPRLSRVLFDTTNASPGFQVAIDGRAVPEALLSVGVPLDGGDHSVQVTAPARAAWSTTASVEAAGDSVTVQIPALELEAVPSRLSVSASATATPPADRRASTDRRWVGLAVSGSGLALIGAGVFLGLRAEQRDNDAAALCNGLRCSSRRGANLNEEARQAALFANVAYALGAAAVASGAILYVTAPVATKSVGFVPFGPAPGVRLSGVF
jgi:hypothetical protein